MTRLYIPWVDTAFQLTARRPSILRMIWIFDGAAPSPRKLLCCQNDLGGMFESLVCPGPCLHSGVVLFIFVWDRKQGDAAACCATHGCCLVPWQTECVVLEYTICVHVVDGACCG